MHNIIDKAYINGKWISVNEKFSVINSADMQTVAQVPLMGALEATQAISAAVSSFSKWRTTLGEEQSKILRNLHQLMLKNRNNIAKIMVAENGKN